DNSKQWFLAREAEVLQPRPFVLAPACAAFEMPKKHRANGAYISGERTHLACSTASIARCVRFIEMNLLSLTEIRRAAQNGTASARVHVQVESVNPKFTREGKPYCELALADACDRMTLRVWSDHPAYKTCTEFDAESFIQLEGEFYQHAQYGLELEKNK